MVDAPKPMTRPLRGALAKEQAETIDRLERTALELLRVLRKARVQADHLKWLSETIEEERSDG